MNVPSDPFAQKVYLRELPDPHLPARYSAGALRRTAQLQGFLRPLQRCVADRLALNAAPTLVVATRGDWAALSSFAYGLPLTRDVHAKDNGAALLVAADYPERLLHRFDDVRVRAAKAGVNAPGELREFLDLLMGHDWGHAVLSVAGWRTQRKWLDEWLAVYLYLLALTETGQTDLAERVVAWARLQVAGSGLDRARLSAFNYPRAKLRLDTLLWFQGTFTLHAADLLQTHGWNLLHALGAAAATKKKPGTKVLTNLDPGFADWLESFGAEETA